jgi:TRAP-type C4-dicarboxylate transport system permease small subunit
MFAIAIGNATLRYLFDAPLVWAEELSRYAMIWGVLIGIALAYRAGQHVAITLLLDVLPARAAKLFRVVCHLLALLAAALMMRSGWAQVTFLGAIQAPSSGLAMGWVYAAIPVGAGLLAIEAMRSLASDLARKSTA